MTLDERVREGLRRSAAGGGLADDDLIDRVVMSHHRGRVRARVLRQAAAVAVVITLFCGVAVFLSWRATPDRYRSVATVGFAPPDADPGRYSLVLPDPRGIALAPSTLGAVLLASQLPADDTHVDFRATTAGANKLALAATAPTRHESTVVTRQWFTRVAYLRRQQARNRLLAQRRQVHLEFAAWRAQLASIDAQLVKVDPIRYQGILQYDAATGSLRHISGTNVQHSPRTYVPPALRPGGPPVPLEGSVRELNLEFERSQLLAKAEKAAQATADQRFIGLAPVQFVQLIRQSSPAPLHQTPPAAVPTLAIWIVALVLLVVAALVTCHRRARPTVRGPA
jgi:hypothetical protein